ncbi:glycosyltransferase family 1 protein [Rhodoferax sp.]|uniref:glycosyltransferase family 4 protein n=1 Tax=Rhodoferax sp. TaxID=50421 RepID=UPI0027347173|nr:glycosyltransferase family 1 protein [Rhodoferax sp.]MDP3190363.1 glycosyltransferase family 1 protein [Rhodoferax sp.]
MKVLINATSFGARPSGARNRFESIYPLLFRAQPGIAFTLLVSKDFALPPTVQVLGNVRAIQLPIKSSNKILRRLFFAVLPLISVVVQRFDVIEDLSQPPTLLRTKNRFLTIHDIRRLEISSSWVSRFAYGLSLGLSRLFGYKIITVSTTMAKRLACHYPSSMISVIENSVPAHFLQHFARVDYVVGTVLPSVTGRYILAVGHIEVRKNYERLIQAFRQLTETHDDLRLIIVGKDNGSAEDVRKLIARLGLKSRVDLLTDISDTNLVTLYSSACALVFPSFYEGFGIPLLEAMATSCPMAISDIDVFREIAGDTALYFDPHDINDMRSAIDKLLASPDLCSTLTTKGKAQLEKFRASELAEKLGALYQETASHDGLQVDA